MKKILLPVVFLAYLLNGFGRINAGIPDSLITKLEEISESRRVLPDKFIEKDRMGIILAIDPLMMLDGKDNLRLYPGEFWLLSYWLQGYKAILSAVRTAKPDCRYSSSQVKIPPQPDYLPLMI